ncbi:hypothetical protein JCM8202v2_001462 [Rhodotorula sphaerocarpa]
MKEDDEPVAAVRDAVAIEERSEVSTVVVAETEEVAMNGDKHAAVDSRKTPLQPESTQTALPSHSPPPATPTNGGDVGTSAPRDSSQDLTATATQNATLSPPRSVRNAPASPYADSPDPLRLIPVPSAASSAGRSQASARSRSQSAELGAASPHSSPTRAARSRGKAPYIRDVVEENGGFDDADDAVVVVARSSPQRAKRPPKAAPASDDELSMTPADQFASAPAAAQKRKGPRRSKEPTFELVITPGQSVPRTARSSSKLSSRLSSPALSSGQDAREVGDSVVSQPSAAPSPRPLSQLQSHAESSFQTSSPLTSLAATSPVRAGGASATASPPRSKRGRKASVEEDSDATLTELDTDLGGTPSAASNPSPKKKRKGKSSEAGTRGRGRPGKAKATVDDDEDVFGGGTARAAAGAASPASRRKGKQKADDIPLEVRQAHAEMNRNSRRSSVRTTERPKMQDVSSSEESDEAGSESAFEEEVPDPPPRKRGRCRKSDTTAGQKQVSRKPPSKKEGKKQSGSGGGSPARTASSAAKPLNSSPLKPGGLSLLDAFGSQTLSQGKAVRQTAAERKNGWTIYAFLANRPLWIHVAQPGKSGFWWPGEIQDNIFRIPLSVKLYLDKEQTIKNFSAEVFTIDAPSHEHLATFLNPSKLRFDKGVFRDDEAASPDETPSDDAFAEVVDYAVARHASSNGDDDDDDDDDDHDLAPASSWLTTKKSGGAADSDDDDLEEMPSTSQHDDPEVDAMLEQDDEETGFEFPFFCLVKYKYKWWPARCTGFVAGSPSKSGRGAQAPGGKFVVEYTDSTIACVARRSVLTPKQRAFFTVPLGETALDIDKTYIRKLTDFVNVDMLPVYQQVIDETYPYAQARNDAFYAGGSKREELAKTSMFGELGEDMIELVQNAIQKWADGTGSKDGPPRGSERYAALTDAERLQYRADVLLPIAIIENYADDRRLPDEADKLLRAEGVAEPTHEQCQAKAYELAEQDLDRRSINKAVLAMRQSRAQVRNFQRSRK